MKKKTVNNIIFLGISSGLIASSQISLEAILDESMFSSHQMLAAKCNGKHGCGGLTASRDLNESTGQDENEDLETYSEEGTQNESEKKSSAEMKAAKKARDQG